MECAPEERQGLARLRTFWGLISAYWFSDRWKEAWLLTAVVFSMTTLLSKSSVWIATASADFIASLAEFHTLGADDPAAVLLLAAIV